MGSIFKLIIVLSFSILGSYLISKLLYIVSDKRKRNSFVEDIDPETLPEIEIEKQKTETKDFLNDFISRNLIFLTRFFCKHPLRISG